MFCQNPVNLSQHSKIRTMAFVCSFGKKNLHKERVTFVHRNEMTDKDEYY